jgi:hypothetical protein
MASAGDTVALCRRRAIVALSFPILAGVRRSFPAPRLNVKECGRACL